MRDSKPHRRAPEPRRISFRKSPEDQGVHKADVRLRRWLGLVDSGCIRYPLGDQHGATIRGRATTATAAATAASAGRPGETSSGAGKGTRAVPRGAWRPARTIRAENQGATTSTILGQASTASGRPTTTAKAGLVSRAPEAAPGTAPARGGTTTASDQRNRFETPRGDAFEPGGPVHPAKHRRRPRAKPVGVDSCADAEFDQGDGIDGPAENVAARQRATDGRDDRRAGARSPARHAALRATQGVASRGAIARTRQGSPVISAQRKRSSGPDRPIHRAFRAPSSAFFGRDREKRGVRSASLDASSILTYIILPAGVDYGFLSRAPDVTGGPCNVSDPCDPKSQGWGEVPW